MSQEASISVLSLAQRITFIEMATKASEGPLRQLRSKLEELDKEMKDSVTDYNISKEECERLVTDINVCEDNLAKSYVFGDLDGVTALEQVRGGLIGKQLRAREEASTALHILGQVSREQQKYRQLIADLDHAAIALTQAVQACSATIEVKNPKHLIGYGGRDSEG
jgi:chromosome segregation ATPase